MRTMRPMRALSVRRGQEACLQSAGGRRSGKMHATMEGAEARQHQEAGIVGTSSTSVAGQRRCSHTHGSNLLVCPPLVTIPPTWGSPQLRCSLQVLAYCRIRGPDPDWEPSGPQSKEQRHLQGGRRQSLGSCLATQGHRSAMADRVSLAVTCVLPMWTQVCLHLLHQESCCEDTYTLPPRHVR